LADDAASDFASDLAGRSGRTSTMLVINFRLH
jgi:hypothetical protein